MKWKVSSYAIMTSGFTSKARRSRNSENDLHAAE